MNQYSVNLAPLRFGAGVKTKIVDGWAASVPCVTTSIGTANHISIWGALFDLLPGAEGMNDGKGFAGLIADTDKA